MGKHSVVIPMGNQKEEADQQDQGDKQEEEILPRNNHTKRNLVLGGIGLAMVVVLICVYVFWPLPPPKSLAAGSTAIVLPFRLKLDSGDKIEAVAVAIDKLDVQLESQSILVGHVQKHRSMFLNKQLGSKEFYGVLGQAATARNWHAEKFGRIGNVRVIFVGSTEPLECLKKHYKANPYKVPRNIDGYVADCYTQLFKAHPHMYDGGLSQAIVLGPKVENSARIIPCAPEGHPDNDQYVKCSYRWSKHPHRREPIYKAVALGVGADEAQEVLDNIYTRKWTSRPKDQFVEDMKQAMEAAFATQQGPNYMASKSFFAFIITERGDLIEINEEFPLPEDAYVIPSPVNEPTE